jgi:hypothetical protein
MTEPQRRQRGRVGEIWRIATAAVYDKTGLYIARRSAAASYEHLEKAVKSRVDLGASS